MKRAFLHIRILFVLLPVMIFSTNAGAQERDVMQRQFLYPHSLRVYDSLRASQLPVLKLPEQYRFKSLPPVVDNSVFPCFAGIHDQYTFYSCQQFCSVEYAFAYEENRLRGLDGKLPENRYPAHYTWNFENRGAQDVGVSFFYSFDVLKQQGHPTMDLFGDNKEKQTTGWMTGYDKYYAGMHNRLKTVSIIPVNSEEGILTVKHYLHDHLDGSPVGGVVFFDASPDFSYNFKKIPAGTPEGGKDVLIGFFPEATHGMTIIGYNDSVRYDINNDGKYTNTLDINGDGVVDAKDWEVGAFRIAGSFGYWWSDSGYCYILYRALALDFDAGYASWQPTGGVWNNCVFVMEPDTGYRPLLTMKVNLSMDSRDKIRLRACISRDTLKDLPEKTISFPVFSFQGASHFMQGFDSVPGMKDMELGLDITPLLGDMAPSEPARLFLVVDDRDSLQIGSGTINSVSFLDYSNPAHPAVTVSPQTDVPVKFNDATLLSAVKAVNFSKVEVTTDHLPPCQPPQPLTTQLTAAGGTPPYRWMLAPAVEESPSSIPFTGINQNVITIPNTDLPLVKIPLPFKFPFYGKKYDTVWVNMYGFVAFDGSQYPYPFLTDEEEMIGRIPCLCPAFSMLFQLKPGASMWYEINPDWAAFRWSLESRAHAGISGFNFILKIYRNGEFEFIYGEMTDPGMKEMAAIGYSDGGQRNGSTRTCIDLATLSHTALHFRPVPVPEGISVSEQGLLSVSSPDTAVVFDIPVKVTDSRNIASAKTFQLTTGITLSGEITSEAGGLLVWGTPASFRMTVTNTTPSPITGIGLALRTADTSVTITDSLVTIGTIPAGGTVFRDGCFSFSLKNYLPDRYPVRFQFFASNAAGRWIRECSVPVSGPRIDCSWPAIHDGDNDRIDPGEIADLHVTMNNTGSIELNNPQVSLVAGDSVITVLEALSLLPDTMRVLTTSEVAFRLQAQAGAVPGHITPMTLRVTGEGGTQLEFPFPLTVGGINVAVMKLGSMSVSQNYMKAALDSLGVAYDYYTNIPSIPEKYRCCFVILGSSPGNHVISETEGAMLSNYLMHGGKLYMEGYATWYYQNKTKLHPMFRYSSNSSPQYQFTDVIGISGQITDSMRFHFDNVASVAKFAIVPAPQALTLFRNDDSTPRCLEWAYDGEDYKTIGTILEFGGLSDTTSPSDKYTLMSRYLDFFGVYTTGPHPYFHAERDVVCQGHPAELHDDSYGTIVSRRWDFPGGSPGISTEKDPLVSYISPGEYTVTLTTSDGLHERKIVKRNFIHILSCAGIGTMQNSGSSLKIWPNPASSEFHLGFSASSPGTCMIRVIDMQGRCVYSGIFQGKGSYHEQTFDCSKYPEGLYIVRVITVNNVMTGKVTIRR
jgi:hypothetical protein